MDSPEEGSNWNLKILSKGAMVMRMPGIQSAAAVDFVALMPPLSAPSAEVESTARKTLKLLTYC